MSWPSGRDVHAHLLGEVVEFGGAGWGVGVALDGERDPAWGIHRAVGKPHSDVFVLAEPIKAGGLWRLKVVNSVE